MKRKVNASSSSLCALDAFRVIMGDFCSDSCEVESFRERIRSVCCSTYAHRSAIPKAVIRLWVIRVHPAIKSSSVSAIRIRSSDFLHGLHEVFVKEFVVRSTLGERIANRQSHYAVIGCEAFLTVMIPKQNEVLGLDIVELIYRSDDIANDSSDDSIGVLQSCHLFPFKSLFFVVWRVLVNEIRTLSAVEKNLRRLKLEGFTHTKCGPVDFSVQSVLLSQHAL
nr:MAG TPA: hypothetical protein [Caudoviricetes sp.]